MLSCPPIKYDFIDSATSSSILAPTDGRAETLIHAPIDYRLPGAIINKFDTNPPVRSTRTFTESIPSLTLAEEPGTGLSLAESCQAIMVRGNRGNTTQHQSQFISVAAAIEQACQSGKPLTSEALSSLVASKLTPALMANSGFERTVIYKLDGLHDQGYLVREPTEFFKKYGPFHLLMLELIKFGTSIVGHVVPTLTSFKVIELADSVKQSVEVIMARIDYSLDCIDNQLVKVQASSQGDFETEPHEPMTQQDLTNYLSDVEGLEGVELRQLRSFLKTSEENLLGNLYRMTTSDGHVKWVCRDHYRAIYQEKHTQTLRDVVNLVQEKEHRVLVETFKINSTLTTSNLIKSSIGDNGVKALAEALKTNSTLTTLNVSHNSTRSNGVKALAEVLRTNSTLTALNLYGNLIGIDGAKALAEALETNLTLTSLNLSEIPIGPDGAIALTKACKDSSAVRVSFYAGT
ncbi:hypothetical protein BGX24_001446 [Mortierella sp. AD032]|nr:hypothetical protein BGX24_001446 [Mortierella sp. AD032]